MKIALKDLYPRWIRPDHTALKFTCPICKNHSIAVAIKAPALFKNYIWNMTGTTFEDISLFPSINCNISKDSCKFHGFIVNGYVEWI